MEKKLEYPEFNFADFCARLQNLKLENPSKEKLESQKISIELRIFSQLTLGFSKISQSQAAAIHFFIKNKIIKNIYLQKKEIGKNKNNKSIIEETFLLNFEEISKKRNGEKSELEKFWEKFEKISDKNFLQKIWKFFSGKTKKEIEK